MKRTLPACDRSLPIAAMLAEHRRGCEQSNKMNDTTKLHLRLSLLLCAGVSVGVLSSCSTPSSSTTPSSSPQDVEGPSITMTSPERAAFVTGAGADLRVQGVASDPAGVQSAAVNGLSVSPNEDGEFELEIEADVGLNLLDVEAVDTLGNANRLSFSYLFGTFAADTAARQAAGEQAAVVALAPAVFDTLGALAANLVAELPADDPEFGRTTISGDDLPICDHLDIESISYNGADFELTLMQGVVRVSTALDANPSSRLVIEFEAVDCSVLSLDVRGRLNADEVLVQADALLDATAGSFTVDFRNVTVELSNYDIELDTDVGGLLGDITGALTEGAVADAIAVIIDEDAGPLIDEQLATLTGDHELMQTRSGQQDGVVVVSIAPHDDPTSSNTGVAITPEALVLRLDGSSSAWLADAEGNRAGALPAVHDGVGPLLSAEHDPEPGETSGLQLRASHDGINLALYSLWQWGVLDLSLDLGGAGALLGTELAEFADLRLDLEPHLPPVAVADPDGQYPLEVQIGELDVHVYGRRSTDEQEELLAVLTANVKAPVDLHCWSTTDETGIQIDVPSPSISLATQEAPLGTEIPEAIERNVGALAPVLFETLAGDALRVASPTVAGVSPQLTDCQAFNAGGYLVFDASFGPAAP